MTLIEEILLILINFVKAEKFQFLLGYGMHKSEIILSYIFRSRIKETKPLV